MAILVAAPAAAQERSVILAFHPGGGDPRPGFVGPPTVFTRLSERPQLSLGLVGATQGAYSRRQALLDMSAGARVSRSGYDPEDLPRLRLEGERFAGWQEAVARARSAPNEIVPGRLGDSVPRGAAYVNCLPASSDLDALVAADREGRVAARPSCSDIARATGQHGLVVVTLPEGQAGDDVMDELILDRRPEVLLVVVFQPPRSQATQMLPAGIAGLPGEPGLLTSRTTRRNGLVTATDLLPTVLSWHGLPIPKAVQGRPITVAGERDVAALRRLERRLRVVYPRRFPALTAAAGALLAAFLLLTLARRRRYAMRIVGLAGLWIPGVTMLTAALAQDRTDEILTVAAAPIALAIVTERFIRWPRAPAIPALTAITAYSVDLFFDSSLIVRSLLGPNPRFGSRFFGIGNELEALLPPLLLIGLAAALCQLPRSRRLAVALGAPMVVLAAIVGAGRLGADVGGVITIAAAAAAAVLLALPSVSRRALALAVAAPAIALAALIGIDAVTGGDAHLSRTILGADSAGDIVDTVQRRYQLAWNALWRGLMPLATVAAIALAVWGFRRRDEHATIPAYRAALGGGLAGGVAGALSNDSGPVLLVLGVVALSCSILYIRGRPGG